MAATNVFLTGGTGYIGRRLVPALIARGHNVDALVRAGSERRLPAGATPIVGNVLARGSFTSAISPASVVVHLVGTPHPSPKKAAEFEAIDFWGTGVHRGSKIRGSSALCVRECRASGTW